MGNHTGTWSLISDSDPRWNKTGRAEDIFLASIPREACAYVDECTRTLGTAPKDLTISVMKD